MAKTFEEAGIYVGSSKTGNLKMPCPRCQEKGTRTNLRDKSLSVHVDKGVWKCHYCNWLGGLEQEGVGRHKAGEKRYLIPKYRFEDATSYSQSDWFRKRKISDKVLMRNKVSFGDGKVKFPFIKDGVAVNVKTRTIDKKFFLEPNCELPPYGYDDIDNTQVIICEGEIDKLSFEEAGFQSVISLPNGTKSLKFLGEYEAKFNEIKSFIIAVDGDEVGRECQEELATRLGKERCKKVKWPEGIKDANELLIESGPEVLATLVANAEHWPIKGIYRIADYEEAVLKLYDEGLTKGLSCGIAEDLFSVKMGECTVITGIPNHGKSTVLNQMLLNLIDGGLVSASIGQSDFKAAIFTPENLPYETYIAKTVGQWINEPFGTKTFEKRMSKQTLLDAMRGLNRFLFLLSPGMGEATPENLCAMAKRLVMTEGIKCVVLDPFNKFEHQKQKLGMTDDNEYVMWFLNMWKNFALNYDCHVFMVAHPRKMPLDEKTKKPVIPSIYDILGASSWANAIDNAITIYRDWTTPESSDTYFYTKKIRHHWVGKIGVKKLYQNPLTLKFEDAMQ